MGRLDIRLEFPLTAAKPQTTLIDPLLSCNLLSCSTLSQGGQNGTQ